MMLTRHTALALALSAVSAAAHAQASPMPDARVDWPTFLGRHDMTWERLPTRWGESAFIGNGRLGATVDYQNGSLGWTINRTDFVHDQSRYPVGRVVLKTRGA